MPRFQKLRRGLQNAFALEGTPLAPEDHVLLNKIAAVIVQRQMALPAILFLNCASPLNSLGSQAMVFLRQFFVAVISKIGILFLMVSFGASFGFTVMGRVSLLIGRIDFLLHDWLRLPR